MQANNRCMLARTIVLKLEILKCESYEIEYEGIFHGNCVSEISIITTQVHKSSLLNTPKHSITCIGAGRCGKFHSRAKVLLLH